MAKIYFKREHHEAQADGETDLRRVAQEAGVEIYGGLDRVLNCRGRGLCGTCKVRVPQQEVLSERTRAEKSKIPVSDPTVRLACQAFAFDDCDVQTFPRVRQSWMEHKCYQHLVEE
jgi:ferredoxin